MEAEEGSGRVGVGVRRDTGVSMVFKAWGLELGKKIGGKSEGLSSAPADTERPQRRLWSSQCSGKKNLGWGQIQGEGVVSKSLVVGGGGKVKTGSQPPAFRLWHLGKKHF